ncbi:MAG: putative cytokinetic ring protein SteA [Peptococcaceae bacterium]|jgi:uncharacterized membrane-anchored protein|nr:putative cytokinetic ring protein SteA [Peptococcaceae bacterium]MDH7525327.1 putative cytokinetic ring protein SteA [Peptococcaceae bacterium]
MVITGKVKVDRSTKKLVKRIQPHEIAVIDHPDLDEVAALSLVRAKVRAVVNAQPSTSGRYPNLGPLTLLKHHIPLIDQAGAAVLELADDQVVEIRENRIYLKKKLLAQGVRQTAESILRVMESSKANLHQGLEEFVDNTLFHARYERSSILGKLEIPPLKTSFQGRQALIVVRGKGYCEDLKAVKSYIREMKPVLVGVDGGADALYENGYRPHLIFGDMDSVSDQVLACGAEVVVHAYTDGQAPGLERIGQMGLEAQVFAAPGTSEDAAMLLAYHGGAELIVAVGTHSSVIDFWEKGRNGMASTLLTRIKVGSILVDAKGVSRLYGEKEGIKPVVQVVCAAFFPFLIILSVSTLLSQLGRLLLLKFKITLGI